MSNQITDINALISHLEAKILDCKRIRNQYKEHESVLVTTIIQETIYREIIADINGTSFNAINEWLKMLKEINS